jgi:hypothetical protein
MVTRWWLAIVVLGFPVVLFGQEKGLVAPRDVESVYAPPEPPRENEGVNEGGVNFNLDITALTDYVWRGIDRSESGGAEDSPNLTFDATMKFDLGRYPHPFIGVFSNVFNSDPQSRFQEIRPYVGFDWNLRPFLFSAGFNSYIFPERDDFNTSELFAKCTLDDSYFLRSDGPLLSPYFFGAYDYDKGKGVYAEFGISHEFKIEDTPITITPMGCIAYVNGDHIFSKPVGVVADPSFAFNPRGPDTGFQHYQGGVVVTYGLNSAFNIPRRWGQFDLKGYLFYTDGIDNKLRADTEFWGGLGIAFSY